MDMTQTSFRHVVFILSTQTAAVISFKTNKLHNAMWDYCRNCVQGEKTVSSTELSTLLTSCMTFTTPSQFMSQSVGLASQLKVEEKQNSIQSIGAKHKPVILNHSMVLLKIVLLCTLKHPLAQHPVKRFFPQRLPPAYLTVMLSLSDTTFHCVLLMECTFKAESFNR